MNNTSSNEIYHQKSLNSYKLFDPLFEKDFDGITSLAAQICCSEIATICIKDQNNWFVSKNDLDLWQFQWVWDFCNYSLKNTAHPLIIEDARIHNQFKINSFENDKLNIVFLVGIPLVTEEGYTLGTLCVYDSNPKKMSDVQIAGLQTLAKSAINLFDLRNKKIELNNYNKNLYDSIEFNNPFFLIVSKDANFIRIGEKLTKVEPLLKPGVCFFSFFEFIVPFDWNYWITNENPVQNRVFFFQSIDGNQRFKFSIKQHGQHLILSALPVINANFSLKNYRLSLNDFSKHDYIAEFLFLQQSTNRSLEDAKILINKLQDKNNQLLIKQHQIDVLARFPSENPNPIIRFNRDFSLSYVNKAAKKSFISDFQINEKNFYDSELSNYLEDLIVTEKEVINFITKRNNSHYNIFIRNVKDQEYINVYATDITDFINEVNKKEQELIELTNKISEQKEFYEFILNEIPSDIAVFSSDQKYLFVNPQGIKDTAIRNFMIGKDDYDYCRLKGISYELADGRKKVFNEVMETGEYKAWIDDFIDKNGNRKVIYRRMGPLKDKNGEIKYVVGYGIEITERKIAEEKSEKRKEIAELLVESKEKSKEELYNDLHDGVNQLLFISKLSIENANIKDNKYLNQALEYLSSAIEEIRKIALESTSQFIFNECFVTAITDYFLKMNTFTKIKFLIDNKVTEDLNLNPNIRKNIFRICQELAQNAIKHSQGSKMTFRFVHNNGYFIVIAKDNGVGINVTTKEGIGLKSIKDRVYLLDGKIRVFNNLFHGLTVFIEVKM